MSEQDPIETLLKVTGRRSDVSADRRERAREAAHAVWRSEVSRRTRLRRAGWVVSLASAAAVVAAVGLGVRALRSTIPPAPSGVRVERVSNVPQLLPGSIIPRGAALTTGADARLALRAPTGHSLRLDVATTLRVLSGSEFALERGAVYVDSSRSVASRTSIRIDTPVGTIEDQGTQFEARLNKGGALILRVREGLVALKRPAGPVDAHAGEAVSIDGSGAVGRTGEPGSGEGWAWVEAIAPMMEIQGKSLKDFLDWVARERGIRVRFQDASVSERSPGIVLRGSISGMTLEQATASVLATCGLSPRWESGALVVVATTERAVSH